MFYDNIFTEAKESYSLQTKLGITFVSGYLAGIICVLVSHPADNLISLLGKKENSGKGLIQLISDYGIKYLYTKGLGTRILMVGTLTGFQWWIYDSFKSSMGIDTTGGGSVEKKK